MSHTVTPATDTHSATQARIAVAAAILFGAALFLTVAVLNVPHDTTDAKLLDWWRERGNRNTALFSSLFAVCAAALFAVVANYVLQLEATRTSPLVRSFARSMATAFSAAMLVTAAVRSTVWHQVDFLDEPLPGVDVLRYSTALHYRVMSLAVMGALALAILAISVLAVRTAAFARWAAYVGLGCGIVMLVAVAVGFGSHTVPVAILWSVCLAVAVRPRS